MGMDANETQCGKETAGQGRPCRGAEGHLSVPFRIEVGNVPKSHREKQGPLSFDASGLLIKNEKLGGGKGTVGWSWEAD